MTERTVYSDADLVDVLWRDDMKAVRLKWHSDYDPADGVRKAVRAGIDFVNENKIENWLVDVSASDEGLSERDYAWINSREFRDMICNSSLRRFVMIPPGPETRQDTAWVAEWETNTLRSFGQDVVAKVSSDMAEIAAFFAGEPTGATS